MRSPERNVLAAFGFAGDGGDACLRFSADFPESISTRNILDFDRGSYLLVCCGRQLFSLLYLENNGTFRWLCVFGAAVGMLVVKSTASPFLVKAGARFGLWIKVISYVAGWLMRPVKYTFRIGKNGFRKFSEVPDGVQEF